MSLFAGKADRALITRQNWPIGALVLGMHLFFLIQALLHGSYLTDDSIQYLTLAENLAEQGVFSQSFFQPFVPDLQRTPGYPVFLMVMGRIPVLILVVQHLLVLLTGWILFLSMRDLVQLKTARNVALLWLLVPYPMLMASMILSESLFLVLMAGAVAFMLRYMVSGGWKYAFATGILMGLATLVRPTGLALIWTTAIYLLLDMVWGLWKKKEMVPRFIGALVGAGSLALVLVPWMIRNGEVAGRYELSSMGEMGMIYGRLGGLSAQQNGTPEEEHYLYMQGDSIASQTIGLQSVREYYSVKQGHEWELHPREVGGITVSYFLDHPLDAVWFQMRNLWKMAKGMGYGWAYQITGSKPVAYLTAAWQLIYSLLVAFGLFRALYFIRRWNSVQWYLMGSVFLMTLVSAAVWADGRYRIPMEYLLVAAEGRREKPDYHTNKRGSV